MNDCSNSLVGWMKRFYTFKRRGFRPMESVPLEIRPTRTLRDNSSRGLMREQRWMHCQYRTVVRALEASKIVKALFEVHPGRSLTRVTGRTGRTGERTRPACRLYDHPADRLGSVAFRLGLLSCFLACLSMAAKTSKPAEISHSINIFRQRIVRRYSPAHTK